MKKLLILVCLLNSFLYSFSQKKIRDSVFIKTDNFEIIYSEVFRQPLLVKYTITCLDGTVPRAGMDFYTNDSVLTSNHKDYENNLYDKGHMAPAADFNCDKKILYETFSYLNCALQNQDLNRTTWRFLEKYERELSKTHKVSVEINLIFSEKSIVLPTGSTVPDAFIKKIKYGKKIEKYYFKNEKPISTDFFRYKVKN